MKLGFSDATIRIVKRGQGCREQGVLCRMLGPGVAPMVTELLEDGYEMEILELPHSYTMKMLEYVHQLLRYHVWIHLNPYPDSGWLDPLLAWSHDSPWITPLLTRVYPTEPLDGYSMIHGDPTLANVMLRDSTMIVTDPMPRTSHRPEIPSRKAVDVGKILQSAAGWESIQGCSAPLRDHGEILDSLGRNSLTNESLLWAAIHTARLERRATKKSDAKVAAWGHETSIMFAGMLEGRL